MSATCCPGGSGSTKTPPGRPLMMAPSVSMIIFIVVITFTPISTARPVQETGAKPAHQDSSQSLVHLGQTENLRLALASAAPLSNNSGGGGGSEEQQIVALKKISCDKLGLVIMAQRVLNVSASSGALKRLDECRQENLLDLELMEMFDKTASANHALNESDSARPSTPSPNPTRAPRDRQPVKLVPAPAECAHPNQNAPACLGLIKLPPEVQQAAEPARTLDGFHLGAQIALGLLLGGLILVATATGLDHQQVANADRHNHRHNHHHHHHQLKRGEDDHDDDSNVGLRNRQRREASNSRFFLDIGPQSSKLRDYRSLSISSNCSSNLFCSTNSVASSSTPILATSQPAHTNSKAAATASDSHQASGNHFESNLALHLSQVSERQPASKCNSDNRARPEEAKLAAQILLAFSLRKTLGQIFEQQRPGDDGSAQPAQESVDSLHGLRFFSMIWVIVIHSYNFAMRWMHFSNTSTLDGVYKSAASQIIANGSFACDSFFFVGGFLLPYLALQQGRPPRQSQQQAPDNGEDVDMAGVASQSLARTASRGRQQVSAGVARGADEEELRASTRTGCCNHVVFDPNRSRASVCGGKPGVPMVSNLSVLAETPAQPPTSCVYCCLNHHHHHHHNHHQQRQRQQANRSPFVVPQNEGPPTMNGCFVFAHEQSSGCCCSSGGGGSSRSLEMNTDEPLASCAHTDHVCARTTISTIKSNHYATEDLKEGIGNTIAASDSRDSSGGGGSCARHFTWQRCAANIVRRYVRMMPLMMAIIGLCTSLLRYLGSGPVWQESTMMYDDWCRRNWWVNAMFLHNFVNRENMCLSHSWYSAVDFQLFLVGQVILFVIYRSRRLGLALLLGLLFASPLITMALTLRHQLPAVPLVSGVSEETMNFYYGEIYIKPYSRAAPYLIGILLAYLMRTTSLASWRLKRWQNLTCWTLAIATVVAIIMAMQPAMNGRTPGQLESALYSGWARPLWACAVGWIIFACITKQAGPVGRLLGARCFVPLSRLTYPAFLIHPIIMASFYGTRQASFQFSHYLMLYLILGNIVITYASAFILAALIELPLLSIERVISGRLFSNGGGRRDR